MKLNDKTNMLLKDFPERLEEDEVLKLLAENISITSAQKEPKAKRKNVLKTLPQDWFYVNTYIHPLYDLLYDTLYQTYRYRHQDNFVPLLNATKEWYEKAGAKGYTPPLLNDFNVDGFSIIGVSGVGKTHCTKHILRKCFNQLIDRGNTTQITYLITNCVDIGSLRALLVKFLCEVDRLIGTNYFNDYLRNTTEKLEAIVGNVGVRHHIGCWIIDEAHHLKGIPFRSAEQIINFFKNVSAVIGMPIIYIGTPEVKSIFGGNFQIARRAEGDGSIFWSRYEIKGDQEKNMNDKMEWKLLLTSLWKRQVLRRSGKLTEALIEAYYEASGGIMKRLIAIHIRAQAIALNSDVEQITPELIGEARQYFQFTENMIKALATGKEELISEYPDLSMQAFNLIDYVSKKKLTERELVDLIMQNNFSNEEVVMIYKALVERNVDFTTNKTENKSKKSGNSKKSKPNGELIDKFKGLTTNEELYEVLKNIGITNLEGMLKKSPKK